MLFDFQSFVEDLRQNPEKKSVVDKYEQIVESLAWDLKEKAWYKEYVSEFKPIEYKVPEEIKDDFDWDLLIQLIAASFSSEWTLDIQDWQIELIVSVQSGDQVVVKKMSDLWWFQVLRLFEIYVEEQINLHLLTVEDEKEKESILAQRDSRKKRWDIVLENLETEKIKKEEEDEKQEKLKSLKDKL